MRLIREPNTTTTTTTKTTTTTNNNSNDNNNDDDNNDNKHNDNNTTMNNNDDDNDNSDNDANDNNDNNNATNTDNTTGIWNPGAPTRSDFFISRGGTPRSVRELPEIQTRRFLVCGFSARGPAVHSKRRILGMWTAMA